MIYGIHGYEMAGYKEPAWHGVYDEIDFYGCMMIPTQH
jgi:hypothetical protein